MPATTMVSRERLTAHHPDTAALQHIGERVRMRLDADPAAYRLPVEELEIYGVAGFFSDEECARLRAKIGRAHV